MAKIINFIGDTALLAYKGFNSDFTCQKFQYEEGKTYIHNGELVLKKSGFHSAPNPMYILNHYEPNNNARFAIVDIRGQILDYKEIYISSEIEIIMEMDFETMVKYWLSKNPDLTQIDLEGQTFLDIAKKHDLMKVYDLILNHKK